MLPAQARVRTAAEHRLVARRGRRSSAGPLTVLLLAPPASAPASAPTSGTARAGVVVPKQVGNSVARNRVRRQLRHLLAPRLAALPSGAALVVRVQPAARPPGGRPVPPSPARTAAELAAYLDAALASLSAPRPRRGGHA